MFIIPIVQMVDLRVKVFLVVEVNYVVVMVDPHFLSFSCTFSLFLCFCYICCFSYLVCTYFFLPRLFSLACDNCTCFLPAPSRFCFLLFSDLTLFLKIACTVFYFNILVFILFLFLFSGLSLFCFSHIKKLF